jgi:hypothetical protein
LIGPYSRGTFNAIVSLSTWEAGRMVRGGQYRVIKPFNDADGDDHQVGEKWEFLLAMFNRVEDELSLCVLSASGEQWRIPLIWKPDAQQEVIEDFARYVCLVED